MCEEWWNDRSIGNIFIILRPRSTKYHTFNLYYFRGPKGRHELALTEGMEQMNPPG